MDLVVQSSDAFVKPTRSQQCSLWGYLILHNDFIQMTHFSTQKQRGNAVTFNFMDGGTACMRKAGALLTLY